MKNTSKAAVLVLASTGVLGQAYIPSPKASKPHKEFIERTYIRSSKYAMIQASEARKREILANIRAIRRSIKLQAGMVNDGIPNKVITDINCTSLMIKIADNFSA